MAGSLGDWLQAGEDARARWFRRRTSEIERLKREAAEAGRSAWAQATRTGQDVAAQTEHELQALGSAVLGRPVSLAGQVRANRAPSLPAHGGVQTQSRRAEQSVGPSQTAPAPQARHRDPAPTAILPARSSPSVMAKAQASPASQGSDPGSDFRQLPEPIMWVDAAGRGGADYFTMGKADEAAAVANALLGVGGPGGFRQRYETNHQEEMARDQYDIAHRNLARKVGREAANAILGYVTGSAFGEGVSAVASPATKGMIGEDLSLVKTVLKGDHPSGVQVRIPLKQSYTVADHATKRGQIVEAKFGPYARLSKVQRRASKELPDYRVDRWGPKHVGRIAGATAIVQPPSRQ